MQREARRNVRRERVGLERGKRGMLVGEDGEERERRQVEEDELKKCLSR